MNWINIKEDQPADAQSILICGMKLSDDHVAFCNEMIATRNITNQNIIDEIYDPVLQALYKKATGDFFVPDPEHGLVQVHSVTHWMILPKAYSDDGE